MLEAAIFDMDGLLIDSEPFWRQSHVEALRKYDVVITEDQVRASAGMRTDAVVEQWRKTYKLEHIPNQTLESEIVAKVMDHIRLEGTALAGAHTILQSLREHNVPTAIASSSAPEIIELVISKLELSNLIQLAYSAKYEALGKPHPGVFLTTAKKLGVVPGNCVVFEDAVSGVVAAKAAGMKCIAVPEAVNLGKAEFQQADLVEKSLESITYQTLISLWN